MALYFFRFALSEEGVNSFLHNQRLNKKVITNKIANIENKNSKDEDQVPWMSLM